MDALVFSPVWRSLRTRQASDGTRDQEARLTLEAKPMKCGFDGEFVKSDS